MSYVLLIAKDGNQPGIVEDVDLLPTNGRRPAIDEEIIITGDVFIVKDIGAASILDLKLKAINRGGALPDSSKVREPTDAFFYRNLRNVQRARSITPNRGSTPVITRNKINVSRKNNKYVFWKEKFTLIHGLIQVVFTSSSLYRTLECHSYSRTLSSFTTLCSFSA